MNCVSGDQETDRQTHLSSSYLIHICVGRSRSAKQTILSGQEFCQLHLEGSLYPLDGFLVLRPLATSFHVANHWGRRGEVKKEKQQVT